MDRQRVLVTGGVGFIGSHTVVELLNSGHDVLIFDNLCNSSVDVVRRIEEVAGRRPHLVVADVRDRQALLAAMREHRTESVVHFAGLKAVGESVVDPLRYYDNNVVGSYTLLSAMKEAGVRRLLFSSSATVYGDPATVPIGEESPLNPTNPYGQTKRLVEVMLRDLARSGADWRFAILRYFNPIGAHPSGLIGEHPTGIPTNLVPFVCQVASGRRPRVEVFGDDWPTPDGTGIRDYLHVVDLARGHVAAMDALETKATSVVTVNLGTGKGYSVLQVIEAIAEASGRPVPFVVVPRRPGDIAVSIADPRLAEQRLGWRAEFDLSMMCRDAWRWQLRNES